MQDRDTTEAPDRVLRTSEIRELTQLGRTTIWRMEKRGDFPKRRQISPRLVGWLESEVMEWLRSRPAVDS